MLVAVEEKAGETVQEEMQRLMDDDAAFLARLKFLYEPDTLEEIEKLLKALRKAPAPVSASSPDREDFGGKDSDDGDYDEDGGMGRSQQETPEVEGEGDP